MGWPAAALCTILHSATKPGWGLRSLRGCSRCRERARYRLRYLRRGVRFLQESVHAAAEFVPEFPLVVPARSHDFDLLADTSQARQGLLAAHEGHGHVENDQGNAILVLFEDLQSLNAAGGHQDCITQFL